MRTFQFTSSNVCGDNSNDPRTGRMANVSFGRLPRNCKSRQPQHLVRRRKIQRCGGSIAWQGKSRRLLQRFEKCVHSTQSSTYHSERICALSRCPGSSPSSNRKTNSRGYGENPLESSAEADGVVCPGKKRRQNEDHNKSRHDVITYPFQRFQLTV